MRVLLRDFGTALCAGLVLASAMFMQAPPAGAAISGSAHDFTGDGVQDYRTGSLGPLTPYGSCSACHVAHKGGDISGTTLTLPGTYAVPYRLWPRNLSDEANYFDQYDTDPVYLSSPALMCYDCHDNQNTAVELPVDPETTSWPVNSIYGAPAIGDPQDIALGDYPGGQGSGKVGYYEMYDGSMPSNPAQTDITGGHFWQRPDAQLIGSPAVAQGEKLSCRLCHEPHDEGTQQVSGESQSMFRTQYWDGSAWNSFPAGNFAYGQSNGGLYSSYNTRAHSDETPDANNHGRNLCSACHGYSNQGNPVTMYSQQVPGPPAFISAHDTSSQVACTNCHRHNKIVLTCDECHGYPPLNTTAHDPVGNPNGQSYAGGAGAHQRHLDALGASIFRCELCHGPNAGPGSGWHPDPDSVTPVAQANINIMGETASWEPAGYPGTLTAAYNGVSAVGAGAPAIPPGYSFSVLGGGDQRCSSFACHGGAPDTVGALNWTDDMLDETTGNFIGPAEGRNICTWCHDGTPATIDGGTSYAPNVMGNGTSFGFEVNGHGLAAGQYDATSVGGGGGPAAANQDCDACHDATYAAGAPTRTHFGVGVDPRDETRLRATINSGTITAARGPDDACDACHQNGNGTDGVDLSYHHNVSTGYTPLEDWSRGGARTNAARLCRQCHEVHGSNWNGTGRNLHMVGKWIDDGDFTPDAGDGAYVDSNATDDVADITAADNAVVFTSFTGANSFDEIDSATPPDSAAQNADDICGTCHLHSATAGAATNAGAHWGTLAFGGDMRETDCMQCHDHDFDDDYTSADAFAPSGCEGCHNVAQYDPGGGLPLAPNVMGPGNNPLGTGTPAKPYDNGTYGFNVNGHGSNGGAVSPIGGYAPVIDLECTSCHNVGDPPGTHNDGVLDGRTPDPANNNPFHLVPGFINTSPTNEYEVQVDFDSYCATTCHTGRDMRHARDPNPVADAVRFGDHKSYPFPSNVPPPEMFYDVNLTYLPSPGLGDAPHFAPCISCHDPHGTGVVSPRSDNVNFMVIYRWKSPSTLCAKCHP